MKRIVQWIRDEARRVFPAVLYFFIAFNLFRLTFGQMFVHVGLKQAPFFTTIIAAIIVGKIMIIADHMPFLNMFAGRPLIYNTIWRTSIYFFFSLLIRIIEHLVPFIVKFHDLGIAAQHLLGEVWWAKFWTVQIWYLVLLFVFVLSQELIKGVGAGTLRKLFLGRE